MKCAWYFDIQYKIEYNPYNYNNSFWNLFYLALITPIKIIEYNGKDCYFLDSAALRHSYIEKETGLGLKPNLLYFCLQNYKKIL